MAQIMMALRIVPNVPETRTLKPPKMGPARPQDISRYLRVGSQLKMAKRGPNPSQLD